MQGKILFLPLQRFIKATGLSHGVMVALQFLVLSVEVRILVRQLTILLREISKGISLFLSPYINKLLIGHRFQIYINNMKTMPCQYQVPGLLRHHYQLYMVVLLQESLGEILDLIRSQSLYDTLQLTVAVETLIEIVVQDT